MILEFEDPVGRQSPQRWGRILPQVAMLFIAKAESLNMRQIDLFDEVFLRLIKEADAQALAWLSTNLSAVNSAPRKTLIQLALHEDISVAGPILRGSRALREDILVKIAETRGQEHLMEFCARQSVEAPLSDKIVDRGERAVLGSLIHNVGARFSEAGYAALVAKAMQHRDLAEALAKRSDVPPSLRKELAARVRDDRTRFKQSVPPALQGKIRAAISSATGQLETPTSGDYSAAHSRLVELSRKGGLGDRNVNRFAVEHEYVNVAAALSVLSGAPLEVIVPLVESAELDGLMVACKAARLSWTTTRMIIHHRPSCPATTEEELEGAQVTFDALSLSVAQRTVRLW